MIIIIKRKNVITKEKIGAEDKDEDEEEETITLSRTKRKIISKILLIECRS